MEVALGASYAGTRAMVSMKHVGLNVAADPFFAASITGIDGGLVVVSADDPGMHSSQNEQDSHYASFAKVPYQYAREVMPEASFLKLGMAIRFRSGGSGSSRASSSGWSWWRSSIPSSRSR